MDSPHLLLEWITPPSILSPRAPPDHTDSEPQAGVPRGCAPVSTHLPVLRTGISHYGCSDPNMPLCNFLVVSNRVGS